MNNQFTANQLKTLIGFKWIQIDGDQTELHISQKLFNELQQVGVISKTNPTIECGGYHVNRRHLKVLHNDQYQDDEYSFK